MITKVSEITVSVKTEILAFAAECCTCTASEYVENFDASERARWNGMNALYGKSYRPVKPDCIDYGPQRNY